MEIFKINELPATHESMYNAVKKISTYFRILQTIYLYYKQVKNNKMYALKQHRNKIFLHYYCNIVIFPSAYVRNESRPSAFLFFLLGAAPHVLMQNSHPQQSPQTFYPRIYITLLFQLKRPKKNMQSMKNAPIYRSAEIMQFVCELFNALAVFYTNSRTFGSGREFPKHKYLRTKSSRFFGWLGKVRGARKVLLLSRTADN